MKERRTRDERSTARRPRLEAFDELRASNVQPAEPTRVRDHPLALMASPVQLKRLDDALARFGEALSPPEHGGSTADGLPADLRAGIASTAGVDLSDVVVHRNSPRPSEIGARALAQGNEIHLGPGAEADLPHEAWHVVQQRQGRVNATTQAAGLAINDDPGLEREADAMGARALAVGRGSAESPIEASGERVSSTPGSSSAPVQLKEEAANQAAKGKKPAKVNSYEGLNGQEVVLATIYFSFDEVDISDADWRAIDKVVEALRALDPNGIDIYGRSDKFGKPGRNRSLSQMRADAVHSMLSVALGEDPIATRFADVKGMGPAPGAGEIDPEARRADIEVQVPHRPPEEPKESELPFKHYLGKPETVTLTDRYRAIYQAAIYRGLLDAEAREALTMVGVNVDQLFLNAESYRHPLSNDDYIDGKQDHFADTMMASSGQIEEGRFKGYTIAQRYQVIVYRFRRSALEAWLKEFGERAVARRLRKVQEELRELENP